MEKWLVFIQNHAAHAHWFLFGATLLAGLNIPISIDLLMIIAATLAAKVVPEHTALLFFAMFFGCIFSAWIAYFLGKKLGTKLLQWPLFSKIFSKKRLAKVKAFNKKRGSFAFIIARFIPFGVRNVLFMVSGMSRTPFKKFALWDAIGCGLWCSLSFFLYYTLGKNIELLYTRVKMVNLLLFAAFSVTVIGIIWYKKKKPAKEGNV
ncbi:MAG: Inner membrane protein [Chlamydiae bacterium]|nr:Inner membrane protein [Chlamydiota bacterium]